jgi:hypothetical protein
MIWPGNLARIDKRGLVWLNLRPFVVGYPSGQRGQTVNLLAYAFSGSNPEPTTTFISVSFQLEGSNLAVHDDSHRGG